MSISTARISCMLEGGGEAVATEPKSHSLNEVAED